MSYNPQNPNGQATSANSAPVVIASDQSAVPVNGNAASGASDTGNPVKVGGRFNSSAPTLTSGQRGDLQLDSSGNLKVNVAAGGSAGDTQYAEGATAATATGTLALGKNGTTLKAAQTDASGNLRVDLSQTSANATALKVDGSAVTQPVSGTVTTTPSGTQAVNVSQVNGSSVATAATGIAKVGVTDGTGNAITSTSNALDVNVKSGGSGFSVIDEAAFTAGTSAFVPSGAVFNDSAAALTSGQQGTLRATTNRGLHANLRNAAGTEIATASNPLQVSLANTAANATAVKVDGSAVTQPVSGTVTSNIGTTNGLALDTSVTGLQVAQGSTTSGQKGDLVQGAVTTAAPSYTTGQTSPLSLDTSGNLRTSVSNTVTVSGTVTSTPSGTQSVNTAQVAGSTVATAATGIQKMGLTDGTGTAITSTSSALDVNIKSGGSSAIVDEAAWTAGSSTFAPGGGVFNDSAAALTSGQQGTFRATANRGLHTNLRNAAGTEIATASNPLQVSLANTAANGTAVKVDGSAVTQPVSGTVSVNALPTGTNSIGTVGLNTGTNSVGTVGLNAGSNNIGGVEIFDSGGTNKLAVNASGQAAVTPTGGDLTSGSQTTKITDGTNTLNVGVGDSANGFAYTGTGRLTQAFSITSVTTTTAQDAGNYRWVSVQITSQGATSTVNFQTSNDNSNWIATPLASLGGTATSGATSATTAGLFHGPIPGRYFRLSITGITSGTTAGTIVYSSAAGALHTMGVAASIAGGVNITLLGGIAIALGNGTTSTGTLRVTLASDSTGQVALAAGTNAVGDVNLNPAARGGWSVASQLSLVAPTNATQISGAAGKFGGYMFVNLNTSPAYIQVFDAAPATTVTVGTTTPTFVIPIPANATPANGAGANVEFANGITIANGIKIAATTTSNGATAVATGLTGFVLYK